MQVDIRAFLQEICSIPGLPGYERKCAEAIAARFADHADEVWIDDMYNVIARVGNTGPKILLSAHQDEIGLVVTRIDKNGFLRFNRNGGVDPRVLPGLEVMVRGRQDVYGVVGAKAPHLQTPDERKKAYTMDDLFIDIGYGEARAKELVSVGDMVTMHGPLLPLEKGKLAGKTMDDRACVLMLLLAAERLKNKKLNCTALFMASVQEEVGTRGAQTGTYAQNPDMNIAVDVTHGPTPDTKPIDAFPLDKVALGKGPNIHPAMLKRLRDVAKRERIDAVLEAQAGMTGTDARAMQIARDGVPTALIELPLKYMHTTVETCSEETLREGARLIAAFIEDIDADWGNWLCY